LDFDDITKFYNTDIKKTTINPHNSDTDLINHTDRINYTPTTTTKKLNKKQETQSRETKSEIKRQTIQLISLDY